MSTPLQRNDDATAIKPRPPGSAGSGVLTLAGAVLLIGWAAWWVGGVRAGHFVGFDQTRFNPWRFLGFDFLHNFRGVRTWVAGGNPYHEDIGDWRGRYAYPPIVLVLYAWSALFRKGVAIILWMGFITTALSAGACLAGRTRARLALTRLPLIFVVAVTLCSMPALFATERGQGDAIVLAMIVVASLVMQKPATWPRDVCIGLCLAVAAWVKVYPFVLLPALVVLGRTRAFLAGVVAAVLIGVVPLQGTLDSFRATAQGDRAGFVTELRAWLTDPNYTPASIGGYEPISPDSHSLTTYWAVFWNHFGLTSAARIPGLLGAAVVLAPVAIWPIAQVWRQAGDRERLAYPLLLWLAAASTFGLPVSYDYNLIYLPLAAFTVCDRRDGPFVMAAMIGMVLWCEPFRFPGERSFAFSADVLFFLKLLSLIAVGASLARRARETSDVVDRDGLLAPMTRPGASQDAAAAV